jgi:hypothetical protein
VLIEMERVKPKIKKYAAPADENAILDRVWDYYIATTGKDPVINTFTSRRRKLGKTRLHECLAKTKNNYDKAEQLIKLAIDGIALSDWHMGRDPKTNGQGYCDWELNIFKSYETMERLWNS